MQLHHFHIPFHSSKFSCTLLLPLFQIPGLFFSLSEKFHSNPFSLSNVIHTYVSGMINWIPIGVLLIEFHGSYWQLCHFIWLRKSFAKQRNDRLNNLLFIFTDYLTAVLSISQMRVRPWIGRTIMVLLQKPKSNSTITWFRV